jgi:hypothetical protein
MLDHACEVCNVPLMIDEAKSRICADCEPRSELVDGKWRLRQQPQTEYQLEFSTYIRWLQAQPKGSVVGDAGISDQCPVHNWLKSIGIDAYVHCDGIMDVETLESQGLPGLFVAVQHEMMHELDLDLEVTQDSRITREQALMCAYFVSLTELLGVPAGVKI